MADAALLAGLILLAWSPSAGDPMSQAYFYEPWQTRSIAYKLAAASWSIRPFDGYHLVLQYQITLLDTRAGQLPDFATTTCDVEVNVADRAERQIQVVRDSCQAGSGEPHSIAEIYALFKERASRPIGKTPARDQDTGCYRLDTGYLDLIDGEYDRRLGYPVQIGNVPQAWLPGNCGSTLLLFPTERDLLKRVRVRVMELTPRR